MEYLLEKRDAPAAAGAGAAAFGKLARHLRLATADEVDQLAPAHVEAVTDFGIEVHVGRSLWLSVLLRGNFLVNRAQEILGSPDKSESRLTRQAELAYKTAGFANQPLQIRNRRIRTPKAGVGVLLAISPDESLVGLRSRPVVGGAESRLVAFRLFEVFQVFRLASDHYPLRGEMAPLRRPVTRVTAAHNRITTVFGDAGDDRWDVDVAVRRVIAEHALFDGLAHQHLHRFLGQEVGVQMLVAVLFDRFNHDEM